MQFVCPPTNGYYPDPTACNAYYQCTSGSANRGVNWKFISKIFFQRPRIYFLIDFVTPRLVLRHFILIPPRDSVNRLRWAAAAVVVPSSAQMTAITRFLALVAPLLFTFASTALTMKRYQLNCISMPTLIISSFWCCLPLLFSFALVDPFTILKMDTVKRHRIFLAVNLLFIVLMLD